MKITRVLTSTVIAMVIAGAMLLTPTAANARVFLSVGIAPPLIPVYEQPLAPGCGYIWTPGYWAYGDDGYYWVDGAWVYPPYVDALWTPGYWGWGYGGYFWNAGYWGRHIGYYGGINYGFGYFGTGFYGGYWNGGRFFYNGAYNHLGFHDGFVYNHPVAGFDGRPGGAAFARNEGGGFNRGGAVGPNRGSSLNGNNFASRAGNPNAESRGGFGGNTARNTYNGGAARSFSGNNGFAQSRGSYAPQQQARSFSGGSRPAPSAEQRRRPVWRRWSSASGPLPSPVAGASVAAVGADSTVVAAVAVATAAAVTGKTSPNQPGRAEEKSSALGRWCPILGAKRHGVSAKLTRNRSTMPCGVASLTTIAAIRSNAPGRASDFARTAIAARRSGSSSSPRSPSSRVAGVTSRCSIITDAPACISTSAFFR